MAMRRTPLRTAVAAAGAIGLVAILGVAPPAEAGGQFAARSADPAVEIVQTVGCVERRAGKRTPGMNDHRSCPALLCHK